MYTIFKTLNWLAVKVNDTTIGIQFCSGPLRHFNVDPMSNVSIKAFLKHSLVRWYEAMALRLDDCAKSSMKEERLSLDEAHLLKDDAKAEFTALVTMLTEYFTVYHMVFDSHHETLLPKRPYPLAKEMRFLDALNSGCQQMIDSRIAEIVEDVILAEEEASDQLEADMLEIRTTLKTKPAPMVGSVLKARSSSSVVPKAKEEKASEPNYW